jgi:hypothetical protein
MKRGCWSLLLLDARCLAEIESVIQILSCFLPFLLLPRPGVFHEMEKRWQEEWIEKMNKTCLIQYARGCPVSSPPQLHIASKCSTRRYGEDFHSMKVILPSRKGALQGEGG